MAGAGTVIGMESFAASATALIGWSLAIASTVTAWPQAIRLIRTKNHVGVDPRTAALAALTMIAWVAYTVRLGDIPAIASSAGPLAAWMVTLTALVILRAPGAIRSAAYMSLAAAGVTAVAISPFWGAIGVLAAAGSAGWAIPQLRTAFTSHDLEGVSVAAYNAMAVENIGWIVYAVLTSTPAYAVGSSVQAPATALIAFKAGRARRRAASRAAHPSVYRSVEACA